MKPSTPNHPDQLDTYTTQPTGRSFKDGIHPWPLCESIDDPRLGLTFDALTASWEPLGLPAGWNEAMAAEYAAASWLILSRAVGQMSGKRTAWVELARRLMLTVLTDAPGRPLPFGEFVDTWARQPDALGTGMGATDSPFKRLSRAGRMRDVHGSRSAPSWQVSSVRDGAVLDAAWERTLLAAGGNQLLPLLPVPTLSCFAPARRLTTIDGELAFVPSLWELLATALYFGQEDFHHRGQQSLHVAVGKHVPKRGRNAAGPPTLNSLKAYARTHNSWLCRIEECAPRLSVLGTWNSGAIRLELTRSMKARAGDKVPRMAPSIARYRRARAVWLQRLANAGKSRRKETPWHLTKMRSCMLRLLLLDLAGQTGARVNEIVALLREHVDPAHRFSDDVVLPAVFIEPSKKSGIRPAWRPIAAATYELLREWMTEWGIAAANAPVFPAGPNALDTAMSPADAGVAFAPAARKGAPVIPHPDDPELGYGIHEVRHLVEQIANSVGAQWLKVHADHQDRVSPQVFADAVLNHRFAEAYDYNDHEANRQHWALRAILGDPTSSVPGVLDVLLGDAGARTRWDDDAIRSALSRLRTGRDELADAQGDRERATQEIDRATRRLAAKPRVATTIETRDSARALVLLQQRLADMTARDELRDVREVARERRHEAERSIAAAERCIALADADLLLISERGRTQTVDDTWPPCQAKCHSSKPLVKRRPSRRRSSASPPLSAPSTSVSRMPTTTPRPF